MNNDDITRYNPGKILSRAVGFERLVFVSGTTADDKRAGVRDQTAQVLAKIDTALAEAGTNRSRILSAVVYLADIRDKEEMNAAWTAWMDPAHAPARACVETRLATPDTRVEIMLTAAR